MIAPARLGAYVGSLALACWLAQGDEAAAFPNTDYSFFGSPLAYPGVAPNPQRQIGGGQASYVRGPSEPGWTILPRVDVSEVFNDNIFLSSSRRQFDAITYITPSVNVRGNQPRLQTQIFYAPTAVIYAANGGQNFLAHSLNAFATLTAVPETLFVDLRGFAGVQPTFGGLPSVGGGGFALSPNAGYGQAGYGQGASPYLTRNNATQSASFSVAPYVVHRFGTFGTVKAGYSYTYSTFQSLSDSSLNRSLGGANTNASLNTQTEVLQFTSGEDFGRFLDQAVATGTQYSGGGVTNGAYQYIASNKLGYALRRDLTVFGELGVEDIRFGGTPTTRIRDAIWSVGFTWTPNADSSVTAAYGWRYGAPSALLNAAYALTARTTLFAQYQTGLGTDLTQLQSFARNSTVDAFGNSVDANTGAPLYLTNSALGFAGNNSLYRTKTLSASAVTTLERDSVSLQISWQDRQVLATTNQFGASSSSGLTGYLGWQHQVNPATFTSLNFAYSRQTGNRFFGGFGNANTDTYSAQASVRYYLSETLSGTAQYMFTDRVSQIPGFSFTQNIFLLGLSKQF